MGGGGDEASGGGENWAGGDGTLGTTTFPLPVRLVKTVPSHSWGDRPQGLVVALLTKAVLVPAKPKKRASMPYLPSCGLTDVKTDGEGRDG